MLNEYPKSYYFDNSKILYHKKKKVFNSIKNLEIVAVSEWLAKDLRLSFLNKYPISIINNGIKQEIIKNDVSEYFPSFQDDDFVLLSVASVWSKNKGYNDFLSIFDYSKKRNLNVKFLIIGVNEDQFEECNKLGIYAIKRLKCTADLAKWYSRANVFFNPSIQETFGLVTVEAMLAGSPIIAYDLSVFPEILSGTNSFLIPKLSYSDFETAIKEIKKNGKDFYSKSSIAKVNKSYNLSIQAIKYLNLYKKNFS